MATWNDVRRIALALPDTTEATSGHGLLGWRVKDKSIAWERPLRWYELRALGDAAPKGPILGVHTRDSGAKDALVADDPDVCFTTPDMDAYPEYPAVLVRLDRISLPELEELIVEAWRARAPQRLARRYRKSRGTAAPGGIPPDASGYRA
jgi:hypothetical protein